MRAGALCVAAAAYPCLASAQSRPLAYGQTLRVVATPDGAIHSGVLTLVAKDTVVLQHDGRQEWLALGRDDRVEVLRRSKSHALIGAALGAALGAGLGATSTQHWCNSRAFQAGPPERCGLTATTGALVYGAVGLAAGGIVGSLIRSAVWEVVPRDALWRLSLIVEPDARGALELGAVVRF